MTSVEGKEELGISAVALDGIERDFVEVMKELSAEDNLERFRIEYENLHRALRKTHENEKRLLKKCQELHQEITVNAAKVTTALRMSQDDQNAIIGMRQEIEKAWKMVDNAHEKESKAKDTIQMLRKEVSRLTTLVERGSGLTLDQETGLRDIVERKRVLANERDTHVRNAQQQAHQLREVSEAVKRLEIELSQKTTDFADRTKAYTDLRKEHENEMRYREFAESKVQDLHKTIDKRSRDLETLRANVSRKTEDIQKMEREVKEGKASLQDFLKSNEKLERTRQSRHEEKKVLEDSVGQDKQRAAELTARVDQVAKERDQERVRVQKLRDAVAAQDGEIDRIQQDKSSQATKTSEYQAKIRELMEFLEGKKRETEDEDRKIKNAVREKNLSVTKAVREEQSRVLLQGECQVELNKNKSIEQELASHKQESEKLSININELTVQVKKYEEASREASKKYHTALEAVKSSKRLIAERQNQLEEEEKRLKNQNALYEQVLSDRNLYSKNHNEATEEIEEMKKRFKVMDQQINQLKDELRKRETDLCEAHKEHDNIQNAYKLAEDRVERLEGNLKDARTRSTELADEIKQLTQIIADCDTEKAKQQMKFNAVTNERNILATQLIRRNEELSLLYEKIRIQQSTLLKGESQYRERTIDIGALREKIQTLRTQLKTSLARIRYVEELRRQVTTLQRALIRERTKVKALFEELQNPMNVHRWRKLEGSDPAEYENILKLHTLQKRLIAKIEESRQKDLIIREKEKEYADLKGVLSRQPGPEIREQITVYHENILKRTEQLRRMSDELGGSLTTVSEYKQEIDKKSTELQDVKQKYYTLKSKNTLLLRERSLANTNLAHRTDAGDAEFVVQQPAAQPRYAGGGFCLSSLP